jgi:hypothetical protein
LKGSGKNGKENDEKGEDGVDNRLFLPAGLGAAFGTFLTVDSIRAAANEDPLFCVKVTDTKFVGLFYVVHCHVDDYSVPAMVGYDYSPADNNSRHWVTPWSCD